MLDLWSVQGFFQRNQQQKLGILDSERKGEKKQEWLRQQNLVTWAQESVTNERERELESALEIGSKEPWQHFAAANCHGTYLLFNKFE